jgi:hypothetical protein
LIIGNILIEGRAQTKAVLVVALSSLLVILPIGSSNYQTQSYSYFEVVPNSITTQVGLAVNVDIKLWGAEGISSWYVELNYDNSFLECTSVSHDPLPIGGSYVFDVRNDEGKVIGSWFAVGTKFSGDLTVFTVTFKALNVGTGNMDFDSSTSLWSDGELVLFDTIDGQVVILEGMHDVLARVEWPFKTSVGQHYGALWSMQFYNEGTFPETFNATAYVNETAIAAFTNLTLSSRESQSLDLKWDTSGLSMGNYTFSLCAEPVAGEQDFADNNFTIGNVAVTIPCDFNGNFKVGPSDFALIAAAYGSVPGSLNWNPNCDVNNDKKVGPYDFAILSLDYGKRFP